MKTTAVLEDTISYIEKNITQRLTVEDIAGHVYISPVHLQRIFRFVFEMPIAEYVRGRKLQKSLEILYETREKVSDIAYDIGFGHESSFIRSFKREYGLTPSEVRKNPHILPIVPPVRIPHYEETAQGILSDVDFVMIPKMELTGITWKIPFLESEQMAPQVALDFWNHHMSQVPDKVNDEIYIGLTRCDGMAEGYSHYTPSVMVGEGSVPPEGYQKEHIMPTLGVRFKYIGNHSYEELNSRVASRMYEKIDQFSREQRDKYYLPYQYYFEKVDLGACDENSCLMEWYTPVILVNQPENR